MQSIYKGLPELFEYVIGLVERRQKREIQAIMAFHLLSEILTASEYAIVHYFALTLNESFLQNSQHGSPYQKWALFTNENFSKVDQYLKLLTPIIEHFLGPETVLNSHVDGFKKILFLFYRLNNEYACCEVRLDEPLLTISAIGFDCWLDTAKGSLKPTPSGIREFPPIAIKSVISIADRSVLKNLQSEGLIRVEELRVLLMRFAAWLEANYVMSDITTVPSKRISFYEHWLENRGELR